MELMTTAEVAAYLRVKERTIYDLVGKGQIPCIRATGKLLFARRLVDRWLESHAEMPDRRIAPPPPIYAGSSDPLLERALRACDCGLAVLARGSVDGLERLAAGEATLAGVHLLDPPSGTYNVEAIRRLVPAPDIVAVRFASRVQGLIVAPGNPLGLTSLADVAARGARLALRPQGAGSHLLLDVLAARDGIALESLVQGAPLAQTQADLASLVAEGAADAGLGIEAAARAAGLGFVSLDVVEPFDLVLRRRDYFEPPVQALLAHMRTDVFAEAAARLGGYDVEEAGRVVFNA